MSFIDELIQLIDESIDNDASNALNQGGIIAPGYDKDIDSDRAIVNQGHDWVTTYNQEIQEETGIKGVKIKYTNASGYFIEVSKAVSTVLPEKFKLKQTLTNALRYTTDELENFEKNLQRATMSLNDKEYNCFIEIRNNVIKHFNDLYNISTNTAYFDFLSGAAKNSLDNRYCTPKISDSLGVNIVSGRHPIIEKGVKEFISNELCIGKKDRVHTITGPNMGGKSTFLRQNALIVIMAHMGIDVPASSANISVIDKVFSRVGAGDNLFLGQSTFMLEMQEISFILQNATKNSFVIIDEIGRGTSTFDGMSLAWSILKYIHDSSKSMTLFATHYHEIIDHTANLKHASNYSVAVGENEENIVFLRKIVPGGVKKSYGIEVAKLAGIPEAVLAQARHTMYELESETTQQLQIGLDVSNVDTEKVHENSSKNSELEERISAINLNNVSPIQSLLLIEELQELIKKSK